jgi:hypothetical protein
MQSKLWCGWAVIIGGAIDLAEVALKKKEQLFGPDLPICHGPQQSGAGLSRAREYGEAQPLYQCAFTITETAQG